MRSNKQPAARIAEIGVLALVLLLAGYLRLANVTDNPGWYTDETTHLDIAQNLLRGRVQYMAVGDSTLLFARPPLFHLGLLALLRLTPGVEGITVLRGFTGLLGVLTCGLVYTLARWSGGVFFGLLAAFLLAIYPQAVLYSRFGFSYNLVAPLLVLMLLGLWRFEATKRRMWLALAAMALGFAAITDIITFSFILPFLLFVRPRELWWTLPLVFVPFAFYGLIMLISAPDAFMFDLRYTLSRLAPTAILSDQIETLKTNFHVLSTQGWMLAGVTGLFALPTRLRRGACLMFWIPLLSIGRGVPLYSLSAYYLIPFLPFTALGATALIRPLWHVTGFMTVCSFARIGILVVFVALIIAPLLAVSVSDTVNAVQNGFVTEIDTFLINPNDARAVAAYVNQHVQPSDVVIVSPPIGWLIWANVADFQMAVAATGQTTPHLPGDLPPSRFVFDITRSRYIIVDDLWRRWGVIHVPTLDTMLHEVEAWPLVFEAGTVRVYANQALAPN